MYDLEGINSTTSDIRLNIELSEFTKDYLKEVIPSASEWIQMTDFKKNDTWQLIKSRIEEVCDLADVRDVIKYIPPYIYSEIKHTEFPYCDEEEYSTRCIWAVKEFWDNDKYRVTSYIDANLDLRARYMEDFYDVFSEFTGYKSKLVFRELDSMNMGSYNPEDNTITLNSRLLWKDNPEELMRTVLHESRHVYQQYAVDHPDKVSVSEEIIRVWKENITYYIRPEWDFEAYVNQSIETDAESFAENVISNGYYYLS